MRSVGLAFGRSPRVVALLAVIVLAVLVAVFAAAFTLFAGLASAQEQETDKKVLVFSKTAGFRHASIPEGIAAVEKLGEENGFAVDATEDASEFTEENLARYDAVVWLSTTGDVLNAEQQEAFEGYVQDGGGYAGVHAAADTEYEWEWYGDLVGAYFDSHPAIQEATVDVAGKGHPSTRALPSEWERTDEWYNYRSNPRGDVRVLATVDEESYDVGDGAMGEDHPIAWCHGYDGGRAWYTGMGHTSESFTEDDEFLEHLLGGIESVSGFAQTPACGPGEGGVRGKGSSL